MATKPKVGGSKDPNVAAIQVLVPDLVVANVEENPREAVERLRAAGIPVWVTFPRTVREGIEMIRELGAMAGAGAEAAALAASLERSYQESVQVGAGRRPIRVFCPIWRGPYMTINRDTYVHDVLAVCGGENVFADRAERYPTVTLEEVAARAPEVILLPDEPYRFRARHRADFEVYPQVPAVAGGRLPLVDGKLLTWYGPRIAEALERLPRLLQAGPAGRATRGSA